MQEKFTRASINEQLAESERELIEFKKRAPELFAMPCGMLAVLSMFMTMVVLVNWSRLEQSILMGAGDMSKKEVIFKLGLWFVTTGLTGLLAGAVFRLRYPFLFGFIVVSACSFIFLGFMGVKNADAMVFAVFDGVGDIIPWRAIALVTAGFGSYFFILASSIMYLLDKSRAEYRELYPEDNIDFEC